jgi:hypothetical protein
MGIFMTRRLLPATERLVRWQADNWGGIGGDVTMEDGDV